MMQEQAAPARLCLAATAPENEGRVFCATLVRRSPRTLSQRLRHASEHSQPALAIGVAAWHGLHALLIDAGPASSDDRCVARMVAWAASMLEDGAGSSGRPVMEIWPVSFALRAESAFGESSVTSAWIVDSLARVAGGAVTLSVRHPCRADDGDPVCMLANRWAMRAAMDRDASGSGQGAALERELLARGVAVTREIDTLASETSTSCQQR